MQKLPYSLESMDSISDDVSTDASSTRSSYQDPSIFEEVAGSESEENDSKFVKEPERAARETDSSASRGSSNPHSNATVTESPFNNKDKPFRNDYINKLANMKIIRPQTQSKPHQTLVIFDWDDTLFPTSFLTLIGFDKVKSNTKLQKLLNKIDKYVAKLLSKAVRFGRTCIVTNASQNWVETSSEAYLPLTHRFIQKNGIAVISARSKYEKLFPNEPKRWKQEAFMELKESLEGSVLTNLMCIGDSTLELEAARYICNGLGQVILKTIKFKEGPRIEELIKQQEVVLEKFDQIYMTLKSLTIKVERKSE